MNASSANSPASLAITILLVVLSLALCLAWIWQMMFVIPEYERLFANFRMRVPAFTQATINFSRFFVKYWYILVFFTLFIAFPVIAYVSYHLRHRSNQRGLSRLWFVLIIGLPLAIQAITFLTVFTPLVTAVDPMRRRG